ncbi:MAG: AraC family transcriptional regulator [Gammaproteobacteria bacterium]|nr:MAG: AraC family transcriptional regulator [Gammaproteobacteria bacterium]
MLKFYRNAIASILSLVLLTTLMLYIGITKSRLERSLFPGRDEDFLWVSSTEPKAPVGITSLTLKEELGVVEYDFILDPSKSFPYTHYSLNFKDPIQPYKLIDLSKYTHISFKIICDPKNVLIFTLFSFDNKVTDLNNPHTRRVSSKYFTCDNKWNTIKIAFDELFTPDWWLGQYKFELGDTGYQLNKSMGFAWTNSLNSPINTRSNVKITDVKLLGQNQNYIYITIIFSIFLWSVALILLFRKYTSVLIRDLKEKLKQDQPILAYKKLSLEPQRDKEKTAVLKFMASEYVNPNLSIEMATSAIGINRTKVNDILKEELGLTFSTYLNKLRLTEAARLLSENKDANISEIAYAVGYNNVSYFNKLFKATYNCAPSTFKDFRLSED